MTLNEQIEWLRIEIERVTFLSDPRSLVYPQLLASLQELKRIKTGEIKIEEKEPDPYEDERLI